MKVLVSLDVELELVNSLRSHISKLLTTILRSLILISATLTTALSILRLIILRIVRYFEHFALRLQITKSSLRRLHRTKCLVLL